MNIEEMRRDYDWQQAWLVSTGPKASMGYTGPLTVTGLDEVAEVIASDAGENDGAYWIAALRLHDGRFVWLSAGCDYAGWDCQAGGVIEVAATLDDLVRWSMGDEDRRRLGFAQPSPLPAIASTPAAELACPCESGRAFRACHGAA